MEVYFKYDGKQIPILFTYKTTKKDIPKRFGLNLLQIFTSDEETDKLAKDLVFDDEKTLDLMKYFIEYAQDIELDEDEFLDKISPESVHQFREGFWTALANFSGPLKMNSVNQIWTELKKKLKDVNLSVMVNSTSSPSESSAGE
jgi:hypothetical protein